MQAPRKYIALAVGLLAFGYYTLLSAKQWTWIAVSSDSGDWLMCSNWWVVPQPVGSPLYISLAHLIGFFTDGNATVLAITILLSCLPSAITIMLVYLIVLKLTDKLWCAVASSSVLLGAGMFLMQSTILEEYASAVCFVTLAFYFYVNGKRKLTALALGLGTAIHALVVPIALMWFVFAFREGRWRLWSKPLLTYIIAGLLPYSLILILMYLDTPRLLAGGLTLQSMNEYFLGTGRAIIGTLSIFEVPNRLLAVAEILLMSLGLAWIALWYGFKKPYNTAKLMLVSTIVFMLWMHVTNMDPFTWTFLCFALPSATIICGLGLSQLRLKHTYVVSAGALVLVLINSVFLNANVLAQERPYATVYQQELMSLSDGSAIVMTAGAWSLGLFYVMSEHPEKNLIPIVFPYGALDDFPDYEVYMKEKFGLEGSNTLELTQDALDKGIDVYYAGRSSKQWRIQETFLFGESNMTTLRPITGLSGVPLETILHTEGNAR